MSTLKTTKMTDDYGECYSIVNITIYNIIIYTYFRPNT